MMRVRRAKPSERALYRGVYPLRGVVRVTGISCYVEDLRGSGSRDDPKYEVIAPVGFHFDEGLHSLLCVSLADLDERLHGATLVKCGPSCGEG